MPLADRETELLFSGLHQHPFSILGFHETRRSGRRVLRLWSPGAVRIEILLSRRPPARRSSRFWVLGSGNLGSQSGRGLRAATAGHDVQPPWSPPQGASHISNLGPERGTWNGASVSDRRRIEDLPSLAVGAPFQKRPGTLERWNVGTTRPRRRCPRDFAGRATAGGLSMGDPPPFPRDLPGSKRPGPVGDS